jgi:hypothetical protein
MVRTANPIGVMEQALNIRLTSDESEALFEWTDFDGDDCFSGFCVTVTTGGESRRFEFGPCVAWSHRRLTKFFRDTTQTAVELGFRNPDARHCDIHRSGHDYRLVIRYAGSGWHQEFHLHRPAVHVQD